MSDSDFIEEARRQLLAEDRAAFDLRVKERARLLAGQHQHAAEGAVNFPADPAGRKAKYDALVARQTVLLAKRPLDRSAVDDSEIDHLQGHIHALARLCRRDGTIPREAA